VYDVLCHPFVLALLLPILWMAGFLNGPRAGVGGVSLGLIKGMAGNHSTSECSECAMPWPQVSAVQLCITNWLHQLMCWLTPGLPLNTRHSAACDVIFQRR
jgi:hypothetical protein